MFGGEEFSERGPIFYTMSKTFFQGGKKFTFVPYLRACLLGGQLCPSPYTFLARQSDFSHLSRKSYAQRKEMTFDRRLKTLGLQLFSVYIALPLKIP